MPVHRVPQVHDNGPFCRRRQPIPVREAIHPGRPHRPPGPGRDQPPVQPPRAVRPVPREQEPPRGGSRPGGPQASGQAAGRGAPWTAASTPWGAGGQSIGMTAAGALRTIRSTTTTTDQTSRPGRPSRPAAQRADRYPLPGRPGQQGGAAARAAYRSGLVRRTCPAPLSCPDRPDPRHPASVCYLLPGGPGFPGGQDRRLSVSGGGVQPVGCLRHPRCRSAEPVHHTFLLAHAHSIHSLPFHPVPRVHSEYSRYTIDPVGDMSRPTCRP